MIRLFPERVASLTGELNMVAGHCLAWSERGRPDGVPVVLIHGGPGAGTEPFAARFFDPERWRILSYDQRGSGASTPLGELDGNTPDALVADLDYLRTHLGIDRWVLTGGSWGATLALLYARRFPERVLGLILRSFARFDVADIDWFWRVPPPFEPEGAARLSAVLGTDAPKAWPERLLEKLDEGGTSAIAATRAFVECYTPAGATGGGVPATLWSDPDAAASKTAMLRIFLHFAQHHLLASGWWAAPPAELQTRPAIAVHGARDLITPPVNTVALAADWPDLDIRIVPGAGHSSRETALCEALLTAVSDMLTACEPLLTDER